MGAENISIWKQSERCRCPKKGLVRLRIVRILQSTFQLIHEHLDFPSVVVDDKGPGMMID